MASSYSSLLRLELIAAGEQAGLWGTTTNQNLGTLLEQAIAGSSIITLTSSHVTSGYTLTAYNGALDDARAAVLNFIGTPGGAVTVTVPASQKWWIVRNSCGQTVTMKTSAQVGGVAIPTGAALLVFCDGTNVYTGIAALTLAQGGTGGTDAATARTSLNVPSRTGGDASGTWAISITGNAATATTATTASSVSNGVYTTDLTTGAVPATSANKVPKFGTAGQLALGVAGSGTWNGSQTATTAGIASWGCEFGQLGYFFSTNTNAGDEFSAAFRGAGIGSGLYFDGTNWRVKANYPSSGSGGGAHLLITTSGKVDFVKGSGAAGSTVTLSTYASISGTGTLTSSSDVRLKTDLTRIGDALAKVEALNGYTYRRLDWDGTQKETGLVAQEVRKVLPEAVSVGDDGYLSVAYGNLVGLLVEAVKELSARVKELESR